MFKKILAICLSVLVLTGIMGLATIEVFAKTNYELKAKKFEKTSYNGQLGAIYNKKYTIFKVWSPSAKSVKVRIYKHGSDSEGSKGYLKEVKMHKNSSTGVWQSKINGNLKNKYYTYVLKHGNKTYETSDIYAKACGVNGERSMIVDLDSTDPEGWKEDAFVRVDNSTDAKIWEVQIADFSHSESSGISKANRAKYLAFTETGTTVNSIASAPSTCVDYLKELGVNYVHINPFYDFGSIDETDKTDSDDNYNWGYDPVNYNCPEGSYSSNPYKGNVRIRECKQMIMALHKAGIGVIMDVVYNHTQKDVDSNFNRTVPDYYYRINNDGTWSNGSGCGNDTASERKMFSKYMVDSVLYWAEEYHIDGFRFDLMGLHDVDTMNKIRKELDNLKDGEKILMYGEPWRLNTICDSDCVLSNQSNISKLSDRIASFDETIRDAVKGSTSGSDQGFVQSGDKRSNLKIGIEGQANTSTGWARATTQCVTYASCHDNLTLWDKLVKSVKGDDGKFRKRHNDLVAMNKLTGAIIYTSQGISFMLAGEEFCRTKNGDENSYSSGFKVNEIDWNSLYTFGDVSDYYKGLIEIRNNISAFRDPTSKTANSFKYIEDLPDGVIAYIIEDDVYGEICMIFNSSKESVEVKVDGDWVQLADENTAGMQNLGYISNKIKVKECSASILVKRDNYDNNTPKINKGKVIVRYFDGDEVFKSYVVNGKIGRGYNIPVLQSISLDYTVTKKQGDSGTFSDSVQYCNFYCDKYEGNMSAVTFMFLDSKTDTNISESIVMTNRQGQTYETLSIPAIQGYSLDIEKLPKNGCGVFGKKNITVKYYYNKKARGDKTCSINIIYMATDGKVLGTDSKTGVENANYSTQKVEFEDYNFKKVTDNSSGKYSFVTQNVLYLYEPVSLTRNMFFSILGFVVLMSTVIFIIIHFRNKKLRLMRNLDIS